MIKIVNIFLLSFAFFGIGAWASGTKCDEPSYLSFNKKDIVDIPTLKKMLKENPKDTKCMIKLINQYFKKGEVSKGFELLVKAYDTNPAYIKQQKIYKIYKIAKYATQLKQRAIKYNNTKDWNMLGLTYYKMGVFNEAIKAYKKSLSIKPTQIEPRLTLALALSRAGLKYRALEELNIIIGIDKDNFFAYYYAGKILKYQIKDTEKAKEYLEKAKILCERDRNRLDKNTYKEFMKDLRVEVQK